MCVSTVEMNGYMQVSTVEMNGYMCVPTVVMNGYVCVSIVEVIGCACVSDDEVRPSYSKITKLQLGHQTKSSLPLDFLIDILKDELAFAVLLLSSVSMYIARDTVPPRQMKLSSVFNFCHFAGWHIRTVFIVLRVSPRLSHRFNFYCTYSESGASYKFSFYFAYSESAAVTEA